MSATSVQTGSVAAGRAPGPPPSGAWLTRHAGVLLVGVLLLALLLRLYVVVTTAYVWDEDREWIRLGRSIAFLGDAHLPWRSLSHTAASAYLVSITSALFGDNAFGHRIAFALAGVVTIWAVAKLAGEWLGAGPALLAAVLLTFNEYHIGISSFAMEKSPYLMCSALTLLHVSRFLRHETSRNLYLAAMFAGFAFLFKETAALLLPVCVIALIASGRAGWLRRRETLVAAGIGLLVVLPDLVWNVVNWERGYGLHTDRLEGVGFNRHFLLFFGRDLVRAAYEARGSALIDPAPEYPAMNALWGALLLVSAGFALLRWRTLDAVGRLATIAFWFVLAFFVFGRPGESRLVEGMPLMVDAKVWFWVDLVLPAAALLGAWRLGTLTGLPKRAALTLVVAAAAVSTVRVVGDRLDLPSVQMLAVPDRVWPADGRLVDIRVAVSSCLVCRPEFRLERAFTQDHDGRGRVPSAPDDVLELEPGTDDRSVRVRAATGAFPDRRAYFLQYDVTGRAPGTTGLAPSVTVSRRRPGALPFWAE